MAGFRCYTPAEDLLECQALLSKTSREIYLASRNGESTIYRDELVTQASQCLRECREKLLAQGRADELDRFAKHLYKVGVMDDNRPYRAQYVPLIKAHLLES